MFVLLRKYSIRLQLLSIGIVILLLLSGTVFWSYNQILGITYKRNSEYSVELISTIQQNIASNADSINRILPNIAYNELVQQYLMEPDRLIQYDLHAKIDSLLVNLQTMKQGIVNIILLSKVGGGFYNCVNCDEYIPFDQIPDQEIFYSGVQRYWFSNPMKHVVYVGTAVYDKRNVVPIGTKIGYAVIVLEADAIAPQLGAMSTNIAGSFFVLDRHDVVVASNDLSRIGKPLGELDATVARALASEGREPVELARKDGPYILHAKPVPAISGKVVSVFKEDELFRGLEEVQRLVVGIFILSIAVMYAFYLAISRNILNPIRAFMTIIYGLRSKGLDNPNKRVSLEGYAEITILARQFNALLDEIDDLAAKLIDSKTHIFELQLLRKQAELQFLKNQINPHFLYNTLETIKGIAHVKGVREIREMTDSLSRIFRYSVKGDDYVLLKEEIGTVEAYIRIQQIRFGDRFDVLYEFDEACLDYTVIKMIMQPLVENAVFHGIEPCLHKCLLSVGCRISVEGELLIWVKDDGVGMDPATLDEIRESLVERPPTNNFAVSQNRHIGIMNANSRIRFAYGPEYGILSIESEPDKGTQVIIKAPARGWAHV
ncbi:MAG: putative two-component sensor kinase [Paenibacillus sp.]|nr:putative two-component sensor kinase [Paenibacillus sp.]